MSVKFCIPSISVRTSTFDRNLTEILTKISIFDKKFIILDDENRGRIFF
mgnify:CR=1 FL=1